MEWTAAIARAVINPRHVYEAQDGHFMERTHLPLKLHLPASVTIGGCMSKEAIEQKEVIVGKLKDSGCRITKQRLILLDVILEGECGSCKEIYYRASKIDHSIGTGVSDDQYARRDWSDRPQKYVQSAGILSLVL